MRTYVCLLTHVYYNSDIYAVRYKTCLKFSLDRGEFLGLRVNSHASAFCYRYYGCVTNHFYVLEKRNRSPLTHQ